MSTSMDCTNNAPPLTHGMELMEVLLTSQSVSGVDMASITTSGNPQTPDSSASNLPKPLTTSSNKKRSWVWEHYIKSGEANERVGVCQYCKKSIACKKNNGNTSLINHLNRCIKYPYNNHKEPKSGKKTIEGVVVEKGENEDGTSRRMITWMFDQERCRKALARMIIVDKLPFLHVEQEGFRDFCVDIQPKFKVPSRTTVTRDCYALYLEEGKKIKEFFKKLPSRIYLTTDTWTSCQNLSYMCLTAHFIDDDWKLCKRIINFCPISGHSGDTIGRAVETCLISWDIEKVFTITVDNASSNDVAILYLRKRINSWKGGVLKSEFIQMRCVAHILGLIVKEGLSELGDSIIRIRNEVKYVRSSPARMAKFKSCIEKEKIDGKSIVCLDVETRWNSTYLMFELALKFQKAFDLLESQDSKYVEDLSGKKNSRGDDKNSKGVPSESDWEYARNLLPFLSIFYNATLKLSASHYVTANEYMKEIFGIGMVISKRCGLGDFSARNMALRMKKKYDKYWGDVNVNCMLFIAAVLDPRCKLKYVNFVIGKAYDNVKSEQLCEKVKITLDLMFDFYQSSMSFPIEQSNVQSQASSDMEVDNIKDVATFLDNIFEEQEASQASGETKSELDKYLTEDCAPKDKTFNVLSWWKLNSTKYPVLASMARDVLAMPVSTVASESAFSTRGRVLDSFRSSLTPKMVEALVCGQDWLRKSQAPFYVEERLEELEQIESDMASCIIVDHPTILFEE